MDHHLPALVQRVKFYIKDTNQFLNKTKKIGKLLEGAIVCTIDVVGLYPNIPQVLPFSISFWKLGRTTKSRLIF